MWFRRNAANIITLGNLTCGILGIMEATRLRFETAFLFALLGAILDVFDGLVARALKAGSKIGGDLDSLADVITFGALPGIAFYFYINSYFGASYSILALLIPIASATRLAIFNNDDSQKQSFKGLPTPAMAIAVLSLTCLTKWPQDWLMPMVPVLFSYLMVSSLRLFSLKLTSINVAALWPLLSVVIAGGLGLLWLGLGGLWIGVAMYILVSAGLNLSLSNTILK